MYFVKCKGDVDNIFSWAGPLQQVLTMMMTAPITQLAVNVENGSSVVNNVCAEFRLEMTRKYIGFLKP